jgi:O-antigen ligase
MNFLFQHNSKYANQAISKQEFWKIAWFMLAASLLLATTITFWPTETAFVVIGLVVCGLVYWKQALGLYLLIPAFFLEADIYAISFADARIRLYHIVILVMFARLLIDTFVLKRQAWHKTSLDIPLIIYGIINVTAIFQAIYRFQSVKVGALIVLLIMLYFILTNISWNRQLFLNVFRYTLLLGVIELALGYYQVFSHILVSRFNVSLPLMQAMQSDILVFGRPYGTFVEPDWFGFVTAIFFMLTFLMAISYQFRSYKLELMLLSFLFFVGNVLSVTRGSWVGIAITLVALPLIHMKLSKANAKQPIIQTKLIFIGGLLAMTLVIFLYALLPQVHEIVKERFISIGSVETLDNEPRIITMQDSLNHIANKPIFGNGPGSYKEIGVVPFVSERDRPFSEYEPFLTNIFLTILNDTGIIGLFIFFVMMYRFYRIFAQGMKKFGRDQVLGTLLFALFVVNVMIFVSFQITTGFWLGITWFFIAMMVVNAHLMQGLYGKEESLPTLSQKMQA